MTVALVKIDVAAADLGKSIVSIEQLVDGSTRRESGLLWVFNLARKPDGRIRALRFWRPELAARAQGGFQNYEGRDIDWVIGQILPDRRTQLHAGEVDALFQIRPTTRLKYGAELPGKLNGGSNSYSRPALAAFLKRRWVGGAAK
jgi:hypothetical protein